MAEQINPWSSTPKMDINRLIADFGIEPFASVKEKIRIRRCLSAATLLQVTAAIMQLRMQLQRKNPSMY